MRGRLGLFALLLLFTVISPVWGKGPGENFALVAENEYLQLFLAAQTTEIAVADKRTGTLWYSNPPSRSKDEKVARGAAKTKLNSQLQIVYYTPQIVRREMDSFNDSVELQQFEITYLPQGVRIDYVFGKEWNDRDMLPVMMSVDEFEVLLAGLAKESERDLLRQNYERISLRKREAGDPEIELADVDVAELLGDFVFYVKGKDLSARESRDLHAAVIDSVVENRREIERRGRLRKHHLESLLETLQETDLMLLGRRITKWDSDDMIAAVRASGYSPLRIQKEHKAASLDPPAPRLEVFKIPLIYRLAGENLLVEIPGGDIEFPLEVTDEKGTRVTYPLYTIKVLPYFGAAGVNEEGYIFVPDGSGALINLNNGKTYATAYSQRIYGNDFSFGRLADEATKTQVFLPVFGLKRGDDAFVAIVEQGASLARINGDVAGRTNSYNTVGAEFIVMAMGQISMPGEDWRLMNIFQREPYLGDFRIRIGFLKADAADYVGMARYYQSYLVEKHGLERRGVKDQIPAFLELIGSVRVKRPLLGVPLSVTEPLTTFSDAARIVAELRAGGVENLHLRYSGWLKGGLEHAYPYQAKLERKEAANSFLL
ncbi:MAG TPA: hypothetical protein GX528_01485, partial [Firmicutes bacterium]|nr:hypothetical protein [Bacillota bacterium]